MNAPDKPSKHEDRIRIPAGAGPAEAARAMAHSLRRSRPTTPPRPSTMAPSDAPDTPSRDEAETYRGLWAPDAPPS